MAMNDTLAGALNNILNAERIGKSMCTISPVSKMTLSVLQIMKDKHYIGEFKVIKDGKGGLIEINLIGGINKCGVIKPRFAVGKRHFEKFEKRYLPARDFGLMIVSTPQGVMTQDQAKEKGSRSNSDAWV